MSLMGVMEGFLPPLVYVFRSFCWMLSSSLHRLGSKDKLIHCDWQTDQQGQLNGKLWLLVAFWSRSHRRLGISTRGEGWVGGVKEKEGVCEGGWGELCSGTQGPQAGRKCSRECGLLIWNEWHARVPCVSARGDMIDWERERDIALGRQAVEMTTEQNTDGILKKYPPCFCLNWH